MDFKSFELLQMGFKIPFALKIACTFKSFFEFEMGFKLPLTVKIAWVSNGLQSTSNEFQMHFASQICKGLNPCIVMHSIKSWSRS
jgi:hypothetical protein